MRVHLSLGSNVEDRAGHLAAALRELSRRDRVRIIKVSRCYETEPLGVTDQPLFLNIAAEIETDLRPLELLEAAKDIERQLGRKPAGRWQPREADIDLILWGQAVVQSEVLTLPHARFRVRAFVLTPLAEIAPDAVDPETGRTVRELAAAPEAQGRVTLRDDVVVVTTP